jgi:hypothetical protein
MATRVLASVIQRNQRLLVFRRLTRSDRYPICSWLVACSFKKAGKTFGVAPGAASPDDIWDFCTRETDKYVEVLELGPLGGVDQVRQV